MRSIYPPTQDNLRRALKKAGITDARILAAFSRVERGLFVPESHSKDAYRDIPLPLPFGRVLPAPSVHARMLEALNFKGTERVLEIGTNTGFFTGLLSTLVQDVYSIEPNHALASQATANLRMADLSRPFIFSTNPISGLPLYSPFDCIVCSIPSNQQDKLPENWISQLRPHGKILILLPQSLLPPDLASFAVLQKVHGKIVPVAENLAHPEAA